MHGIDCSDLPAVVSNCTLTKSLDAGNTGALVRLGKPHTGFTVRQQAAGGHQAYAKLPGGGTPMSILVSRIRNTVDRGGC